MFIKRPPQPTPNFSPPPASYPASYQPNPPNQPHPPKLPPSGIPCKKIIINHPTVTTTVTKKDINLHRPKRATYKKSSTTGETQRTQRQKSTENRFVRNYTINPTKTTTEVKVPAPVAQYYKNDGAYYKNPEQVTKSIRASRNTVPNRGQHRRTRTPLQLGKKSGVAKIKNYTPYDKKRSYQKAADPRPSPTSPLRTTSKNVDPKGRQIGNFYFKKTVVYTDSSNLSKKSPHPPVGVRRVASSRAVETNVVQPRTADLRATQKYSKQ